MQNKRLKTIQRQNKYLILALRKMHKDFIPPNNQRARPMNHS